MDMPINDLEDDEAYTEIGNYILSNEKLHDVQFIVGDNQKLMKAARLPLINQSRAWWSMLSEDSPLMEKGDIHLPDIEPEVFTLLLRHSYGGLETMKDLPVLTVMCLCYAANKYLMKQLMNKIAIRLKPKDVDSIFPALHCLIYYNLRGAENSVKRILSSQTCEVLDHPEFLECDVDLVTYICQQDTLNCCELDLWNAVTNWAKHRSESSDGAVLRKWMAEPLKHIRILTLSAEDLRDHVFPTQILDYMEIINTCIGDLSSFPNLCNVQNLRRCASVKISSVTTVDIKQSARNRNENYHESKESVYSFMTTDKNIKLVCLTFRGQMPSNVYNEQKEHLFNGVTFSFDLQIKATRITNLVNNTSDEAPIVRNFRSRGNYFDKNVLDMGTNGIVLLANSKYKVELKFSEEMPCWLRPNCGVDGHQFEHGKFFCSFSYQNGMGITPCHILQFSYREIDN